MEQRERHGATRDTFRESKKPKRYLGYAAYTTKLIEAEPSTFEEAIKHQRWKDAMNEEYQSIMKNGVWEIFPRPEDKFVVTSKWFYKIKHVADGSIEKYKARFVARVSPNKKASIMKRNLHLQQGIQLYVHWSLWQHQWDGTSIKWMLRQHY